MPDLENEETSSGFVDKANAEALMQGIAQAIENAGGGGGVPPLDRMGGIKNGQNGLYIDHGSGLIVNPNTGLFEPVVDNDGIYLGSGKISSYCYRSNHDYNINGLVMAIHSAYPERYKLYKLNDSSEIDGAMPTSTYGVNQGKIYPITRIYVSKDEDSYGYSYLSEEDKNQYKEFRKANPFTNEPLPLYAFYDSYSGTLKLWKPKQQDTSLRKQTEYWEFVDWYYDTYDDKPYGIFEIYSRFPYTGSAPTDVPTSWRLSFASNIHMAGYKQCSASNLTSDSLKFLDVDGTCWFTNAMGYELKLNKECILDNYASQYIAKWKTTGIRLSGGEVNLKMSIEGMPESSYAKTLQGCLIYVKVALDLSKISYY